MEDKLNNVLEELLKQAKDIDFKLASENITHKYRENKGGSGGVLKDYSEILTYALVRMPATLACFKKVLNSIDLPLEREYSLLDVGSGTGAGIIALVEKLNINKITAIEKELEMINLSKILLKELHTDLKVNYIQEDAVKCTIKENYDIVLAGFILNELTSELRINLVKKLWQKTNKYLILLDPGKPDNHRSMIEIKQEMEKLGAKVIAPCMTFGSCPLSSDDWCHFIARVRRSRTHRQIKSASESYEDEKFTYLVFSKDQLNVSGNRIIRRPLLNKGRVTHTLCTKNGIQKQTYSKSQKDIYKRAKDAQVGDLI